MALPQGIVEQWCVVDEMRAPEGQPNAWGLFATPLLLKGRLLVLNSIGRLLAYDDGGDQARQRWTLELGPIHGDRLYWRRISDLATDGQTAFVPGSMGDTAMVYAVTRDGDIRWQGELPTGTKRLAVGSETLFVAVGNLLLALDAATGQVSWQTEMPSVVLSLACPDGMAVYAGARDGCLYSVAPGTGRRRWAFETGRQVASRATASNGLVYFGSNDGSIYCIKDDGDAAKLIWKHGTGSYVRSAAVTAGNLIYAGSWDRHAYALDAQSGRLCWTFRVNNYVDADPIVDPVHKVVYFLSTRRLYAMALESGQLVSETAIVRGIYLNNSPALDRRSGTLYVAAGEIRNLARLSALRLTPHADGSPPQITLDPRPQVPKGFDFPVMATPTHGAGVARVTLNYRAEGDGPFASTEFVRGGWGSKWVAFVPGEFACGRHVEYYVEATAVGDPPATARSDVHRVATFSEEPVGSGWYPGDPHCHDEFDHLIQFVSAARANGCCWIAVSNHLGIHSTESLERSSSVRFVGIGGDEVGLPDSGEHVLNINGKHGLNMDAAPQESLDQINAEGGVVYLAHGNFNVELYGWKGTADWMAPFASHEEYDAVWNKHLNDGHKIFILEGSDDRQNPRPATYVYVEALTRKNIIDALRTGRSFVAYPGRPAYQDNAWRRAESSKFYEMDFQLDGAMMGQTIRRRRGQSLPCEILAAGDVERVDLIRGDYEAAAIHQTLDASDGRVQVELELMAQMPTWYRLQAHNRCGGLVLRSNPIWVDLED